MPRGVRKPKIRFTSKAILELPGSLKGSTYRDAVQPGLGVQIYSTSGRRVFFVEYSIRGRKRRYFLGDFPAVTCEQARRLARDVLSRVVRGEDPLADLQKERRSPTMGEAMVEFFRGLRVAENTAKNWRTHARKLEKLRSMRVCDVSTGDLQRIMDASKVSTRSLRVFCIALFRHCEILGYTDSNPAHATKKSKPCSPRTRIPTDDEYRRLHKAMAGLEEAFPSQMMIFRLLMITGCRKNEIASLRWDEVFYGASPRLELRHTKTGLSIRPLSPQAVELLKSIPKTSEYVFPMPGTPSRPWAVQSLHRFWVRVCNDAKVKGLRIHDLRRGLASLIARQSGIVAAAKILGDSLLVASQTYIQPSPDHIQKAAVDAGEAMAQIIQFPQHTKEGAR